MMFISFAHHQLWTSIWPVLKVWLINPKAFASDHKAFAW